MSMASPTLRSSSSTVPGPSFSSWATERLARPSTAEMLTGTSNTGARSTAVFSSPSSIGLSAMAWPGPSSPSCSGVSDGPAAVSSDIFDAFDALRRDQALGGEGGVQRLGDSGGRLLGIEGRAALAPFEDEGGAVQLRIGHGDNLAGKAHGLRGHV